MRGDAVVVLGRVAGAHGVRGKVRVRYFGDGPGHLLRAPWVALAREEREPGDALRFAVRAADTGRHGEVSLALEGVEDRDAAQALAGRTVLGDAAHLEPLPEGEYYWYELIGCEVETPSGERIGFVREIWETGAHDVLVVENEGGKRCLLPAAPEIVTRMDADSGRIAVADIPGLLEFR